MERFSEEFTINTLSIPSKDEVPTTNPLKEPRTKRQRRKRPPQAVTSGPQGDEKQKRGSVEPLPLFFFSAMDEPSQTQCIASTSTGDDEIGAVQYYGSEDDSSEDEAEETEDSSMPSSLNFLPVQRTQREQLLRALDIDDTSDDPSKPESYTEDGTDFPRDPFHFVWVDLANTPICHSERRETFTGVTGPTRQFESAYDAFTAIWEPVFMEQIVLETNRYAQQTISDLKSASKLTPSSRLRRWKDTCVDELYVFFGVILATGICIKSDISEYFSNKGNITDTLNFPKYLTYSRFILLSKMLHFNDNSRITASLTRNQAKLAKIEPIIKHLNARFQSLYDLQQNIVIDQSLTRQFVRKKHGGLKTYELSESASGYLWRFEVCNLKEPSINPLDREASPLSGNIPRLVMRLVDGLHYRGHTVWMDNFYNSPSLSRFLKSKGIDCAGTFRPNRQHVPRTLAELKKDYMSAGEIIGCTSGDVDLIVWRDKNKVCITSTYHGNTTARKGTTSHYVPIAVHDYNVCMGGVDKKNRLLAAYPIERQRIKLWYKKFFRRLLNISVFNSMILHRGSCNDVVPHRAFRVDLIRSLLKHSPNNNLNLFLPVRAVSNPGEVDRPMFSEAALAHFPTLNPLHAQNSRTVRRTCVHCNKKTTTHCEGCRVALCAFTCHKQYHRA